MFGYIRQMEIEVTQEAVRTIPETVEESAAQASEADAAAGFRASFWRWWISLYRPESRPTTAGL
jgi:hypothetical protein